jgi:hypothetical protein
MELFVERKVLQGTVKRYQKNIALTNFLKVDGSLIDTHKEKLNEIFERCCGYLNGHSDPEEIHGDPTLLEITADFNDFMTIKTAFK